MTEETTIEGVQTQEPTEETVWYCIPSKRPASECAQALQRWKEMGYKLALFCDSPAEAEGKPADLVLFGAYEGYPKTVNRIIKRVLDFDSNCNWVVTGGDDISPDPKVRAVDIASQCSDHFSMGAILKGLSNDAEFAKGCPERSKVATFGVMQPTGDRWGEQKPNHPFVEGISRLEYCKVCNQIRGHGVHMVGAYIDRVAGSPFIGREFCRRMYKGNGPFWSEFFHMFDDEHLQQVALKLGVFWQRPDLTHHHDHWGRPLPGEAMGRKDREPAFLAKANSQDNWNRSKAIFERLKAGGFAEAEDLLP